MRWKLRTILLVCFTFAIWTVYYCFRGVLKETTTNQVMFNDRVVKRTGPVTRDPNRKLTYTYSIDKRMPRSNKTVDINGEVDIEDLGNRAVIVSGFGLADTHNGKGMLASVQTHMPNKRIVIYNLGIRPQTVKYMKALCNVEVRQINYDKYPDHIRQHKNGAWKIYALKELLQEYGVVFFASPKIRFRAPIDILFPFVKQHHGIIGRVDSKNQTTDVTHPSLFRAFGLTVKDFVHNIPNNPVLSDGGLLFVNNSALYTSMIEPLVLCASKRTCIVPIGSTKSNIKPKGRRHTHYYEMSAITVLMYTNIKSNLINDTHVNNLMGKVYQMAPVVHINDYQWAHFCNPAKKEVNCQSETC